jgi:hypothetical protein
MPSKQPLQWVPFVVGDKTSQGHKIVSDCHHTCHYCRFVEQEGLDEEDRDAQRASARDLNQTPGSRNPTSSGGSNKSEAGGVGVLHRWTISS